ncbi:hypothetical protein Tco_0320376 [Tanacetum coccineum]
MTAGKGEYTPYQVGFALKVCRRSTRTLTHGLPRWKSVCSLNDPRAKIRKPMIEKNEGQGLIRASNRLKGLEASPRQYKYKQGLTNNIYLGLRLYLHAPTEGYGEAIVLPEINADHFEIKTNLLQLVQANPFNSRENENPHAHINSFKRITEELLRAPTEGYGEAIVIPEINADHFEIN